jgi:C4-dicarboxylate-specific signal transduction histidine kinase
MEIAECFVTKTFSTISITRNSQTHIVRKLLSRVFILENNSFITDAIKDKIFQPFFITKPTGQGTGLGLSLAYDNVKAHGGEIAVESNTITGTTFTINLNI